MDDRWFNVWPDGLIEEINAEGGIRRHAPAPDLFNKLVEAGYPAIRADIWRGLLHLRVQDGELVFANVGRIGDEVQALSPGTDLFLSWLHHADQEASVAGS